MGQKDERKIQSIKFYYELRKLALIWEHDVIHDDWIETSWPYRLALEFAHCISHVMIVAYEVKVLIYCKVKKRHVNVFTFHRDIVTRNSFRAKKGRYN